MVTNGDELPRRTYRRARHMRQHPTPELALAALIEWQRRPPTNPRGQSERGAIRSRVEINRLRKCDRDRGLSRE